MRDKIKFIVQKLKPMNAYALQNLPKKLQPKWDKITKPFQPGCNTVTPAQISNAELLSGIIFRRYGYGTFNVLFFNYWNLNKHFSRKHRCKHKRCDWYKQCNRWQKYKPGRICKDNPKFRPNWCVRIKMIISPSDSPNGYSFKVKNNRMHYFRKWFWKG